MLKREDSERGQVIVLFALVFTIFLMLAAFAIDQGFWYGRKRVTQKDADAAARAGAAAYIGDLADQASAEALAEQTAEDNGVNGGIVTIGSDTCTGTNPSGASVTIDAPSVEVQLTTDARRFLSALPLISSDNSPVEVSARAIACLGRVTRLAVGNGDDVDDENRLKGIPIALRSDAPGPNTCFASGALRLGFECVIYGTKAPPPGIPTNTWAQRRVMFNNPPSNSCRGGGSVVNSFDEIEDGLEFACTVTSLTSCTDSTCVRGEDINNDENSENVFDAMEIRLGNGDSQSDCAKPLEESPEQAFQNAFGNGDGDPSLAPDPPGLGDPTTAPGHVYVQNDCYGNPRIVVMPIVSSSNTSERDEPVRGFATVYITGCYDVNDTASSSEKQENECDGNWDVDNCDNPMSAEVHCFIEIRGVPIHQFIVEGSLGGISEPTSNAPLTIQTVK